jgi:hypothetical protein
MMDLDDEAAPLPIVNDRGPLSRDPSSRASDAPYGVNRSLEVWNATGSLSYATLVIVQEDLLTQIDKIFEPLPHPYTAPRNTHEMRRYCMEKRKSLNLYPTLTQLPTVLYEEDLLTQIEKIYEPLPHPYTASRNTPEMRRYCMKKRKSLNLYPTHT